jgi:hypothetical protein
MTTYRKIAKSEDLERISIQDVQLGDELADRFRISLGVVASKPVVSPLGSVSFDVEPAEGGRVSRYLSPWAPPGADKGTVLRVKKG